MIVEFTGWEEGDFLVFPDYFFQRAACEDVIFSQLFLQSRPIGFSVVWHNISFIDSYMLGNSPARLIAGRIFK